MEPERWIVRLFVLGGVKGERRTRSAHAGGFGDFDRACARADAIARRCRRRGINASVTVRPLLPGGCRVDDLIDGAAERGSYHVGSYAGVAERLGDEHDGSLVEAVAL